MKKILTIILVLAIVSMVSTVSATVYTMSPNGYTGIMGIKAPFGWGGWELTTSFYPLFPQEGNYNTTVKTTGYPRILNIVPPYNWQFGGSGWSPIQLLGSSTPNTVITPVYIRTHQ
ncbi:MAG: hypothetical protein WAV32_05635 [Halobacteriota archaeon]